MPDNQHAPTYPFLGFVLNLNVSTEAHRDKRDLRACMVLDVGEHSEGDLVLYEPGLVVPLRNGDLIIFPSDKITHFNLHFEGIRASVVLHSDGNGTTWAKDRNGWAEYGCVH